MCRLPPTQSQTDSDAERDEGEPSWSGQGSRDRGSYDIPVLTRAFEWPSPEGDGPSGRLEPRASSWVERPLRPISDTRSGPAEAGPYQEESDSRHHLRPAHYVDAQYGRHRSAPLYGWDDWGRRTSFGQPARTEGEGTSSRVVLPPVRDLLGELGMLSGEEYERGPVLPQLQLPEEQETTRERDMGEERRGKRGRMEMDEKRPVGRKIYVACDFCRGRKLRCDGGRPRCSNCETRSLACKYQDHPRRRGPGKAPKGSRGKKAGRKSAGDPDGAGPSVEP